MKIHLKSAFSKSLNLNVVFLKSMNMNLKIKNKMNESSPSDNMLIIVKVKHLVKNMIEDDENSENMFLPNFSILRPIVFKTLHFKKQQLRCLRNQKSTRNSCEVQVYGLTIVPYVLYRPVLRITAIVRKYNLFK